MSGAQPPPSPIAASKIAVLRAPAELDLAAIADFEAATSRALAEAGPRPLLTIDLTDTDVIAPVAVGVLLDVRRRCARADGRLMLIAGPSTADTLEALGVASLFDIAESGAEHAL